MSWDWPSWQQGLNHPRQLNLQSGFLLPEPPRRPSNGTGNSGSIASSWRLLPCAENHRLSTSTRRLGDTSGTCHGCASPARWG